MIKWLSLPESTKRNAFIQIAEETGMSAFAVEKDWWVSRTLEIIFQMDIAKHLVFKGGTSLSKAWNLINRFSEDIDLAIDMDFFMTPTKNWSKGERTKLRKTAGEYSTGIFFVELEAEFLKRGFENLHFTIVETSETDRDPRVLEIQYPNLIEQQTDYMLPRIQIEVSCRSLREPFSIQKFGSLVDEVYFEREFAQSFFQVPTVNPERTFLEKIFLLHEEFKRPEEKMRVDRLSRHLYDVYHLTKAGIADRAINDKELYETIVSHRYLFSKIGGVDYNSHNPATLNPIPPNKVQKDWESDYAKMKEEMIYEKNPPSFEDLISNLSNLKDQLLNVGWKFELTFKP
jgi:predicted nucleotidyltransferase component of viral defense system